MNRTENIDLGRLAGRVQNEEILLRKKQCRCYILRTTPNAACSTLWKNTVPYLCYLSSLASFLRRSMETIGGSSVKAVAARKKLVCYPQSTQPLNFNPEEFQPDSISWFLVRISFTLRGILVFLSCSKLLLQHSPSALLRSKRELTAVKHKNLFYAMTSKDVLLKQNSRTKKF